ncbi:methyltransferase domain-containing protein [Gracilimonas sp.]|uniref:methyltransferase domain-containing protein n=1 Tax=Gracilimonas sp. TaxID=1974203 RepID=UPI002871A3AA|nr:hypothetical protein [Gracilimonas sp.]
MKLISDEYKEQNRLLHESKTKFGQRGHRHLNQVRKLYKEYKCSSIIDYGCGKADLSKACRVKVQNYDPGIPEYDIDPDSADLVVCTDVLEHIEPELLDNVLSHLQELTLKVGWFVIATRYDRSKTLPDGSNPHRVVKPGKWWKAKLSNYFTIEQFLDGGGEAYCTLLKR